MRLVLAALLLTGCAALKPPPGTPEGKTVMTCFYGYTVTCFPMRQSQIGPSVHGDFTTPPVTKR